MALQTVCGLAGISISMTPIGRSASTMPLMMAGVDAIAPA